MRKNLFLYADAQKGGSYVVEWVKNVAQRCTQIQKPAAIIVPHPETAIWLRKILALQRCSFVNIHFWSPGQLRAQLLKSASEVADFPRATIASREQLHLILSSVGGSWVSPKNEKDTALLFEVVENHPALALRIFDLLESANLSARMFESLEKLADLAEIFYAALENQGLRTVNTLDRLLASHTLNFKFDSLLLFGFHGGHWPLFPLLSAACKIAKRLDVLLEAPRDASFDLDSNWIGTWEAALHLEALPLEEELASETQESRVEFLVEESLRDLARAIALRAVQNVAQGAKEVAVVFSAYGVLSREVALVLNELEIPHYDAIGHTLLNSDPLWRSWCAFQRNYTVPAFIEFLVLLPEHSKAVSLLQEASRETLSHDVYICIEFARIQSHGSEDAEKLTAYSLLPEETSLAEFCDIVEREFSRMAWWELRECLCKRREFFQKPAALLMRRSVFLHWLEAVLCDEQRVRDPLGAHPYAAIQLLRSDQAAICSWTHAILAGMNTGEWPEPMEENGFLPADTIAHLNQQIAAANRGVQTQGAFGDGHFMVTQIPCLGPRECSALQRRDFQSLRQVPHLIATTALKNISHLPSRPSLWFSELFRDVRGKLPLLEDLRVAIPARIRENNIVPIQEVSVARSARLDPTSPFGVWEFSLSSAPPSSSLAVVDVERILREPAIVWMKTFLGVEPPQKGFLWTVTAGIWAHRWLRSICCSGGGIFPDETSRKESIFLASEQTRTLMVKACSRLQKQAPPWWTAFWQQARSFASQFSDQLETFRPHFPFAITEISFRDTQIVPFTFPLRGRWDLVLCNRMIKENDTQPFGDSSLLIIDYKTGQDLRISSMSRDGTGVQLALYSHAALAWGAQKVDAMWITPHTVGDLVHLPFEELEKANPVLLALDRMVCRGTFGMRGELRSEFTFQPSLPLATLSIPQNVLKAKWELTHNFS